MPNRETNSAESTVREALVALEGMLGCRVFFISLSESDNDSSAVASDLRGPLVPVVWERRCFGHLQVESAEGRGSDEVERGVGKVATRDEIVALFARLLGRILNQSRQLKQRVAELNAVYRVSAAMTRSTDVDDLLKTALKTLIEVVDVSAGSIRLLERKNGGTEGSEELVVRAAINLSQEYFDRGPVIANESELDVSALNGEMVYVENLANDSRVRFPDLVETENLQSFLCTGLIFNGRPLGVIRLYTKRSYRQFSEYEQGLVRVAAQQIAAAIANRRLVLERREARQTKRQLELAANVQQRMLPQHTPLYRGIDLAGRCLPSLELGGDFYDFLPLDDHNLGLAIGDVVGKGVPAALMAASVKAELRAHARYLYDLDEIMNRTNRDLVRDTRPNEFATLWYGAIDTTSRRLTFCNAGHEPPLVCRRRTEQASESELPFEFISLFTGGMIIGYDESIEYDRDFIDLKAGDLVIVFSDGLTDAMNFDDERYGLDRVKKTVVDLLSGNADASAEEILNHILWEVRRFFGFRRQTDDITLLIMRITE